MLTQNKVMNIKEPLGMPYQVDYSNEAAGKWISITKRCIKFRFGYTNKTALLQGKFGVDCRSYPEHEVQLKWSITSGKSCITYDGNEIHFDITNKPESKFEKSWMTDDGHNIKLYANAVPISTSSSTVSTHNNNTIRQFDMLIDGRSYFMFPLIFELGSEFIRQERNYEIMTEEKHYVDVPKVSPLSFVDHTTEHHQPTSSYNIVQHNQLFMEIA